jgi:hypothetical protein
VKNLRKKSPSLFSMVVGPVGLIIVASFALSAAAVVENMRFIHAADQVLILVSEVRSIAAGQKGFAQNAGEDIWDDLEHVGQIIAPEARKNPWGSDIHAVTVATEAMRIETDLPARDCRRLSLYFLNRQPVELGLLSIQAQSFDYDNSGNWAQIYPTPIARKNDSMVETACGTRSRARLALILRVR